MTLGRKKGLQPRAYERPADSFSFKLGRRLRTLSIRLFQPRWCVHALDCHFACRLRSAAEIAAAYGIDQADVHETVARPREVVCMESNIVGFEAEGRRAKALLRPVVTDLTSVEIFITARRDTIYAHSNFKKADCHHPTKLATNQSWPIEVIAANLVATESDLEDPYFLGHFWRTMVDDFAFFVDESVLASPRYKFLDFDDIEHVTVLLSDGSRISLAEWTRRRTVANAEKAGASVPRNPWIPGLFYLFVLVAVLLTLRFITGPLVPVVLPLLIVGGLLAVAIVGAFTLRNQELLKEKTFLELMIVSLSYLPVVGSLLSRKKAKAAVRRAT